jgi:hypothetical protein
MAATPGDVLSQIPLYSVIPREFVQAIDSLFRILVNRGDSDFDVDASLNKGIARTEDDNVQGTRKGVEELGATCLWVSQSHYLKFHDD